MISSSRSSRARWALWFFAVVGVLCTIQPAIVRAQPDAVDDASSDTEVDEGIPADTGADDSDTADATESDNKDQTTALEWVVETSGWIGAVLLLMSIYFVAKVVMLYMELREDIVVPAALLQQWEEQLSKKDYQGIYKSAKEDPSELGQLVAAGLSAMPRGLADARDAIERGGEAMVVDMEKRISMLAVIGSLGPMIGLLGTLKGMIASFSVIALSETQLKPSEVAGGISEALLITFEGVALSVPAIFFFAVFRNRVATLSVQAVNAADELIRRIQASGQSRSAAASAAATAATAQQS